MNSLIISSMEKQINVLKNNNAKFNLKKIPLIFQNKRLIKE